jgi:hypothetical protein
VVEVKAGSKAFKIVSESAYLPDGYSPLTGSR